MYFQWRWREWLNEWWMDAMNGRNEWTGVGVGKSYDADHKRITLTQWCGTAMFLHREAICLFQCHLILAANFFVLCRHFVWGNLVGGGAFAIFPSHSSNSYPPSCLLYLFFTYRLFMYDEWVRMRMRSRMKGYHAFYLCLTITSPNKIPRKRQMA
jgi:hypothetical protein